MTSVGTTKLSPENPFGRKSGEESTEAEAQEICVKIITHIQIYCDANTIFTDFIWVVDNGYFMRHTQVF